MLVYRKLGESVLGRPRRKESSVVCQELIGLMQGLQLHRGLSGAVLDGENGFADDLDAVEQKISRSLYALSDHHGENHPILRHEQWQAVIDHWRSLSLDWRELDFYTNLFAHNEVIRGLVAVLQVLSAHFGTHLCPQQGELTKRWPVLIEQLGVLRALGLHYLTYPHASRDRRVKQAMHDYLGYVRTDLKGLDPRIVNPATVDATRHVLTRVEEVLNPSFSPATPQDYYVATTGVIDAWYRDLQHQLVPSP